MLDGRIEAANVFGAQYYLLEQHGLRKLVDTTFIMGFLVSEAAETEDLEHSFRAMPTRNARSTSTPTATSTTGIASCPTICATAPTCAGSVRASGSFFEP